MKLSPKYYAEAWFQALTEKPADQMSATSQLFLKHVYGHSHGKWLPEIIRLMEQLEHLHNGTTAVKVRSAHPLSAQLLSQAVEQVMPHATTGKTAIIQSVIDPAVIGGVQIETADQRWDLSLRGQLRHLTQTLSH